MADTSRTRAAILVLFADNVTGQISPQDLRDYVVTAMPAEFANPEDFWKEPDHLQITTDKTVRGWIDYSQTMHGNHSASFGMPLALISAGTWIPADLSRSVANPVMGIAADSYASGATNMQVLRKGLIYDSGLSRMSGFQGKPVYLQSAATSTVGSIDTTVGTSDSTRGVIGYVEASDVIVSCYKWRFDPTIGCWAVTGI